MKVREESSPFLHLLGQISQGAGVTMPARHLRQAEGDTWAVRQARGVALALGQRVDRVDQADDPLDEAVAGPCSAAVNSVSAADSGQEPTPRV